MKFADPKNDLAFKKIFGNEQHKSILISFLNSVLDFKEEKTIVDVTLTNPYQLPQVPELKETILDIKATNKNGDTFIVEMQRKDLGDFHKRSLFYTSKAYVEQLPKGGDYEKLQKVYFIGILNFSIFDNKEYISRHLITNQETLKQDLDDFEFTFIELSKFDKKLSELSSILDKWIYFIKYADDFELIPKEYETIEEFKDAFFLASQCNWNKKELEVYDYMTLKAFDEIHAFRTVERKAEAKGVKKGIEQGIEQGIKQGIEKGIEQGIEQGIEKGIEKGIEQGKIDIVKKSILQGLDNETIVLITGFDKEFIEMLKKSYE